jgi:hypothetical protein
MSILSMHQRFTQFLKFLLRSRYHLFSYLIVASSPYNTPYPLHIALALILDPVKNLFVTRNLDFVLKRLAVLHRRFIHIN